MSGRHRPAGALAVLLVVVAPRSGAQDPPASAPRVVPVHVVPRSGRLDVRRLALHIRAVADVREWYGHALGGVTFRHDPIVVQRSRHTVAELGSDGGQATWPLLEREFADYGLAWNAGADFKLLLLVQGGGVWAASASENGTIGGAAAGSQSDTGDLGGLAILGDSALAGVLAGRCPREGEMRGAPEWCGWNAYRGALAHDLGHTWGLPHPDRATDDAAGGAVDARCGDGDPVMRCARGFPNSSLLGYEAAHLRLLRYFRAGPTPQFELLSRLRPMRIAGDVRLSNVESADSVVWVKGHGDGTGYPWAVVVGRGSARWPLTSPCGTLVTEVAPGAGSSGRGVVSVVADGDTLARLAVGDAPAARLNVHYCHARTLEVHGAGGPGFRAVLGNPRLYRLEEELRGGAGERTS